MDASQRADLVKQAQEELEEAWENLLLAAIIIKDIEKDIAVSKAKNVVRLKWPP
jgi:hypothetical protein